MPQGEIQWPYSLVDRRPLTPTSARHTHDEMGLGQHVVFEY